MLQKDRWLFALYRIHEVKNDQEYKLFRISQVSAVGIIGALLSARALSNAWNHSGDRLAQNSISERNRLSLYMEALIIIFSHSNYRQLRYLSERDYEKIHVFGPICCLCSAIL